MQTMGTLRRTMSLVLAAFILWGAGCAQDVGDIDRTQPDKVKKSVFQNDDEWYYRQTVVDTDMQASVIFISYESALKRVRWEITENVLYAYSTVEVADGLNDGFDDEDTRRLGAVAAFPIQGHFDVQRQYNASTGEQSNVISENSSDRPWYEREFMRVDWSTNLVDGFWMIQNQLGSMAAAKYRVPMEAGKVDPDRTRISDDYIDTVTEYTYEPDIYACYYAYGLDTVYSCEGGRIRMRSSFLKVPEEKSYEPLQYLDQQYVTRDGTPDGERVMVANIYDSNTGFLIDVECTPDTIEWIKREYGENAEEYCDPVMYDYFSRFGYFRTERVKWDRRTGTPDSNRRYYANRWNIWQTMYDEDGELLDMKDRTPKPITYHLNLEYPRFMFNAAQVVANEWDVVFKKAAAVAKGISVEELEDELESLYGHRNMYRIVENSCHPGPLVEWKDQYGSKKSGDKTSVNGVFEQYVGNLSGESLENALWELTHESRTQLCAELEYATEERSDKEARFDWERTGDLRYSFFNWVEQDVPWAGYGPSAADPTTGEIISGNANFAGGYIRRSANYGADLIQYFNDELDFDDIRLGDHVRQYIRDVRDGNVTTDRYNELSVEGKKELASRLGASTEISPTNFERRPEVSELPEFFLRHGKRRVEAEAHRMVRAATLAQEADTRREEFFELPEVKALMMRDTDTVMVMEAAARERFGSEVDESALHQAYLEMMSPRLANQRMQNRDRFFSERNIMSYDSLERAAEMLLTYRGAAEFFAGKSRDELELYFLEKMFIGTQLHEVGHTVGLRHNFSASMDALNYHDEYWNIQEAVADGTLSPEDAYSVQGDLASEIAGKEDVDYLSQTEFQLASVMDYTGDLTGRFAGMGKYDQAAINFAYAEVVEEWSPEIELPNLLSWQTFIGDYKELPQILAGRPGASGNNPETIKQGIDIIQNGRVWKPIKEAMANRREGIIANATNWHGGSFSNENQPFIDRAIEYEFCSDEYRDSQLGCDVWDFGANHREIVNHTFNTYRIHQPFWRYRRHHIQRGWDNYNSYINRMFSTLQTAERPFRYYSIYQWYDLGSYTDDLREASMDAMNFYGEILAMPEPGRYCKYDSSTSRLGAGWFFDLENTFVPASEDYAGGRCDEFIDIDQGPAQYYGFKFTDEYDYRIDRVGSQIDKAVASQMMFEISANFAYSAFFTDQRATNISYWTLFRDEFLGLIRGVLLGDYQGFGGVYDGANYQPPKVIDKATFGRGLPNSQEEMPRIYSPISFNDQFSVIVGAMLNATTFEDRAVDFAQYVKVAVSQDEMQQFGPDVELVEFVHPISHQIYVAPQTADGKSITYEMVEWANRAKIAWEAADSNLQNAAPGTAAYESARRVKIAREEQMEDIVAKLDLIRFVFKALDAYALR